MKTSVKKMNLRSFKLNRVYLDPGFGSAQNVKRRRFSWSWILKDFIQFQKQEGKFVAVLFTSSIKRQIRRFHVVIVQWTSRKWTKKRDARAELLFWSLKLLFFWSRRCGRCRGCLSSLICLCSEISIIPILTCSCVQFLSARTKFLDYFAFFLLVVLFPEHK